MTSTVLRLAVIALLIYAGVTLWYSRVEERLQEQQPVSYTHLDVYKRQILHPPFHFENDQVVISDTAATEECIRLFSRLVEQSLD